MIRSWAKKRDDNSASGEVASFYTWNLYILINNIVNYMINSFMKIYLLIVFNLNVFSLCKFIINNLVSFQFNKFAVLYA